MTIAELEQIFTDQQAFRQLTESIRPGSTVQLASLVGSSLSLVAHGAIARLGGVHVLVAEDRDAAGYLYNDLYPLTGGEGLFFFPTGYKRSIQYGQEDPSGLVQRTTALNALRSAADKPLILCTYPEALTEKVADRERLSDSVLKLRRGDNLSTAFVEEALRECRFERVEFVYEPGQYSVRGGIVDIFSYSDNKPYRIDFFGDEIDSIRPFDVGTQLSTGTLDEVEIVPNLKTVTSVEHRVSLARFAGEVTYWIADGDYTLKRFDDIRTKILGDLDEPSSDRHAGHQPQRISLRREEGGFRVVARQRPRAARRSPRRVRPTPQPAIQQEIRSAGRRHQREPSEEAIRPVCSPTTRLRSSGCRTSSTRSERRTSSSTPFLWHCTRGSSTIRRKTASTPTTRYSTATSATVSGASWTGAKA